MTRETQLYKQWWAGRVECTKRLNKRGVHVAGGQACMVVSSDEVCENFAMDCFSLSWSGNTGRAKVLEHCGHGSSARGYAAYQACTHSLRLEEPRIRHTCRTPSANITVCARSRVRMRCGGTADGGGGLGWGGLRWGGSRGGCYLEKTVGKVNWQQVASRRATRRSQ